MSYRVGHPSVLDSFRGEWVRGHLDYQRAADALEAARLAAGQVGSSSDCAPDHEEARRAEQNVEKAGRRLAEIEAVLARQFDRFCGVGE
jgi:hypothetical protein